MNSSPHGISLKRRLLFTLLVPLGLILLALGAGGAWLIGRAVETSSDRVLSGSLEAIAETLTMQQGNLTLDLPPSALGMLENADRDNVYYSISYRGKLITGYPELGMPHPALGEIAFRYAEFHNKPIRIAFEQKLVPQLDSPVLIQVAETTKNRTAVARRMLEWLVAAELFLLFVIAALVYLAVDWGLQPLAALRREIEERNRQTDLDFTALPLTSVPQEALALVSAFNALLRHVDTAFDSLKRFTSDASHQLRAPLAVARTHVELLQRRAGHSVEMHEALADVSGAIKNLQHLIVQLISLAKAEQPEIDADKDTFDLIGCAAATARNHAAGAIARNVDLGFDAECDNLQVMGNALYAGEIIANLLDNAIGYAHSRVTVRITSDGILDVEDDGPGIPLADRDRAFERFCRLPNDVEREGSGLGLSIVLALVRRMGASVDLHTAANGRGLDARVRFRCADA